MGTKNSSRARLANVLITLAIIMGAIAIFVVYTLTSKDLAPDSLIGYTYAIIGTLFILLASIRYTLVRRSRRRGIGVLNGALRWHVSFGIIALVLLFLHSFGNFNPRSGTYALYGMIALVISGFIGRMLDRFLPRLIAQEASNAMTSRGDDRIMAIMQRMQNVATYSTQQPHQKTNGHYRQPAQVGNVARGGTLPNSWTLAPLSLEEKPQDAELEQTYIPKNPLSKPGAQVPSLREHMAELNTVQRALYREQYYRAMIRYWRVFHVCLALLTPGLIAWHLIYVGQLLYPVIFGR